MYMFGTIFEVSISVGKSQDLLWHFNKKDLVDLINTIFMKQIYNVV